MLLDLVLVGLAVSAAAVYIIRLMVRRVRGRAAACSCGNAAGIAGAAGLAGAQPPELGRGAKPGSSACSSCSGCPYSANGSCLDTAAKIDNGSSSSEA